MVSAETRLVGCSYSIISKQRFNCEGEIIMSQKKRRTQSNEYTQSTQISQSTHMYQPSKSIKQKGSGCGCGKKTSR